MLHPNQVAIDYIWERFVDTSILEGIDTMKEIVTIQKSLQHRSFNPQSESHQNLKVICKIKSAKSPLAIHI
jgi:hypothetical protein